MTYSLVVNEVLGFILQGFSPSVNAGKSNTLKPMFKQETEKGSEAPVALPDLAAGILLRSLAAASPLVIFLALPPFYNGIWVQVEGAMPWLHLLAAVAAATIAWLAARGDPVILASMRHPLVLIPAATALLTTMMLPWVTLRSVSLLGSPEHGFGALAFLEAAVMTAAMMSAWSQPFWRRITVLSVTTTTAGIFILDALFRSDQTWTPFFFGDYLAFYALYTYVVIRAWMPGRAFTLYRTRTLFLALFFAILLVLSGNKASLLSGATALAALLILWNAPNDWRHWLSAALFPLLIGGTIILIGPLWNETLRDTLPNTIGIGPLSKLIIGSWASLWSRAMLIVVGAQALFDEPYRFIVGMGWGHYSEALLTNLTIVDSRLQEFIGESRAYWDAIRRSDFHSHNHYLEALLSLGISGLVLAIYYLYAVLRSAREDMFKLAIFFVLFLGTLQSFWFQMPHGLPVMAAALAAITRTPGPMTRNDAAKAPRVIYGTTLALVMAATLFVGFTAANQAANSGRNALNWIQNSGSSGNIPLDGPAGLTLHEFYHASLLQTAFARLTTSRSENGKVAPARVERIKILLTPILNQEREIKSAALTVSTVNVLAGLLFRFPEVAGQIQDARKMYLRLSENLAVSMPRRSDLLIPYFNLLLRDGEEQRAASIAEHILLENPDDAVALWFAGIIQLAAPQNANRGLEQMRRALKFGIRNRIPISPPLLRELTR